MENFLSEKKLQVIFFRHTFRHADLYTMRYAFHHRTSHEFIPSVNVKKINEKNGKTIIKQKLKKFYEKT